MTYNTQKIITSPLIQPVHGVTTCDVGEFQTQTQSIDFLTHLAQPVASNRIFTVTQVHGSCVHILNSKDTAHHVHSIAADGLVLKKDKKPLCIFVKTADCIPLFLWDSQTSNCALVHSGWKGTYENIAKNAIDALAKLGSGPATLYAFIGPYIHMCCYEVYKTRADLFDPQFVRSENNKLFLNMGKVVLDQLITLGVHKKNIDHSSLCTSCDKRFFSYRRENTHTHGTMIAYIVV